MGKKKKAPSIVYYGITLEDRRSVSKLYAFLGSVLDISRSEDDFGTVDIDHDIVNNTLTLRYDEDSDAE